VLLDSGRKDGGESCELQDQIEAAGFERQALPVPAEQRCAWQWSARGSQSVHQQVKADQAGRFGAQADELPDDATGAAAHFEYSQLRKVRNPAAVEQSGQVLPAVRNHPLIGRVIGAVAVILVRRVRPTGILLSQAQDILVWMN